MDRELVEAARNGDREAFGLLAHSNADWLFAVAQRILRDFDRAEDAVRRHVQGGGIVWLNSTGSSLPYEADFTSTMDLTAHTNKITGQWAHVIIPGSGIILKNSGLLVQDTTTRPPTVVDESNAHDSFDPGGVAELCAALGG